MSAPTIAKKEPAGLTLEAGTTSARCARRLSQKQPFRAAPHKPTEFRPVVFKQEKTEEVWLCQCKQSKDKPFCDGTHNGL